MASDIYREQTESEKRLSEGGFKDLREWRKDDFMEKSRIIIDEKFTEWVYKKRLPYSKLSAFEAVEVEIQKIEKEMKRRASEKEYDFKLIINIDFDKFGYDNNKSDWILTAEKEIMEDKLLDGIRQTVKTGVYKDWFNKKTKEGLSIEFKNSEIQNGSTTNVKK